MQKWKLFNLCFYLWFIKRQTRRNLVDTCCKRRTETEILNRIWVHNSVAFLSWKSCWSNRSDQIISCSTCWSHYATRWTCILYLLCFDLRGCNLRVTRETIWRYLTYFHYYSTAIILIEFWTGFNNIVQYNSKL